MSTEEGVTENSPNSNAPQTVPVERLNELIADRKRLEHENLVYQQMLRQQVPQRQQAQPRELPAHLKQLKEENPAVFQEFMRQEQELKRGRANAFQMMDKQDEMQFIMEFGDKGGREMLGLVNQKLSECRDNGNHNFNRGQIFLMLKGYEGTTKKVAAPQTQQQQAPQANQNFPGQDPSAAQALTRSSAAASTPGKDTIEDLEKRLENYEF